MIKYIERNQLWIIALIGGMIIGITPLILATLGTNTDFSIPKWVSPLGLTLAGVGTGFGAMLTDTASAKVVRYVGSAFAVAVILYQFFG